MISIPEMKITKVTYRLLVENISHFMNFPEAGLRGAMGYFWKDEGQRLQPLYETFFGLPTAATPPKAGMLLVNSAKDAPDKVLLHVTFLGNRENLVGDFSKTLLILGEEGIGKCRNRFIVEGMTTPSTQTLAEFMDQGRGASVDFSPGIDHEWTLKLKTPLSLRGAEGRILESWSSEAFGRNLVSRIAGVAKTYGSPVDWDESHLLENFSSLQSVANVRFERRNRTSSRQQKNLDYSGLVGSITLRGLSLDSVELIRMGEQLAVGKNTVFGSGRIKLVP